MSRIESKTPQAAWEALSPHARRRLIIQAVVSVLLVVVAFRSLSKRSESNLRGPKPLWTGVIPVSMISLKGENSSAVVPIGSMLYFAVGRRWRQTG